MKGKIIGALLIIILFVVGGLGYKLIVPMLSEQQQKATSDAMKVIGTIRIGIDDWIGYFLLESPEFKSRMRKDGYLVEIDKNPDIERRMKMLADGRLDFAVFETSSDILTGVAHDYPGVITFVIDKSVGGDSIWAVADKVPNLDVFKGNNTLRVAFTPKSPSHHFFKAASLYFAVPEIIPAPGDPRRIEINGAEEAYKALVSGSADVVALWAPWGSRIKALPGKKFIKIMGSEDTEKLIVDNFVTSREVSTKRPEMVQQVHFNYFQTLKYYRDFPDQLIRAIKDVTRDSDDDIKDMLAGVNWPNLRENCEEWFGIAAPGVKAEEGLVETIESTVKILINAKDFSSNPIPNGDPYRLIQSKYLQTLYVQDVTSIQSVGRQNSVKTINTLDAKFKPLDESGWKKLRGVGTKTIYINFAIGSSELDNDGKQLVDDTTEALKKFPLFRLLINGHTMVKGDKDENQQLSLDRAEAVARYLQVVYNIDPNRMKVVGFGGTQPLAQEKGESKRAWEYRLPRVEIVLLKEDY